MEASSRGCAVIITNKGGLKEAASNALVINNLNEKNLFNAINKLITNKSFRENMQKNSYKKFYLTNEYISKKIDNYRLDIIKS